jgi:hypothetical protein
MHTAHMIIRVRCAEPDAETEVAVAWWLESAAFPAVRPAVPADQPVVADDRRSRA